MNQKLSEEKQKYILETATEEFGQKGLFRSSIRSIAKKSGVSVGVIYKYYADKEALFFACLDHSMECLAEVLGKAADEAASLEEMISGLIHACVVYSREHEAYFRMYHSITSAESGADAAEMAGRIEGGSAAIYTKVIKKARSKGLVKKDADPAMLAFFFDNLLMMLHFSLSCDYYKSRMSIYLGDRVDEGLLEKQLLSFIMHGIS